MGVVSGRNAFFCLTDKSVEAERLGRWAKPLVARSAHLSGLVFDEEKLEKNRRAGFVSSLLALPADLDIESDPDVAVYLQKGELAGVHTGYKTRIRNKWWSVPSIAVPDGFMLRQISSIVRLFANHTNATSTDTIHRVFLHGDVITIDQLSVAALNSITIGFAEVYGRSYGGGILEIEPSEAVSLPIPDPKLVTRHLVEQVSSLLDGNEVEKAIDLVDASVLVEKLSFTHDQIKIFRDIRSILSSRRKERSTKS
ncbi:MAG: hypothetical protein E6709_08720 [Corynebacterium sp.]|nr:hypothetical protein [Corynebacterium sp.]MDU3111231.1 hypothetical protein [Corynebacterium sp.]